MHDVQGSPFDHSVIMLCVRWYLAYGLSLRELKEMMAERGIGFDHSTIHRWVVHFPPLLLKRFNQRKRAVGSKWHMDETSVKVRGQWMYLYRAIDSVGDIIEFWFSEHVICRLQNASCTRRLIAMAGWNASSSKAARPTGRRSISCDAENRLQDRSRRALKAIRIPQSQHLNNRIEQDHRRIKRRVRPMKGFKAFASATVTLGGIEMIHIMRKQQGRFAFNPMPSLKEQFEAIAA
ncbi:MAG: IS6 family transposase [Devosia sp.]